ncbi:adenylosuccinate synthase [bacterium]|nr:adenylosuccinate synthase [bacterium]
MSVTVVLGTQWGDEGKGKIVDLLSWDADIVARFQGGANAGHTIVHEKKRTVLHLIPSGILHKNCICLLGSGMVIDPVQLLEEIDMLEASGVSVEGRLFISHRAHLIMPYHKILDGINERNLGSEAIGVTGRGIGPAYTDKIMRVGIRIVDLLNRKTFRKKLEANIIAKNQIIKSVYGEPELDCDKIYNSLIDFDKRIDPLVKDVSIYLSDAIERKETILCEGAQGTLLDIDWGTYPYVTSSSTTAGGAVTGLGIGPTRIDRVLGVLKAYTTRVGAGPFPTEFDEEMNEKMRDAGDEFGATTGRARRCGWLDLVIGKYSAKVNGIDAWALTKLDVLSHFDTLKICTAYEYQGKHIDRFPADLEIVAGCQPVYEELPGWRSDISEIRDFEDLPDEAKTYINRICELTDTPVSIISVGSERNQTIRLDLPDN